jgi:hypothetical protein
VRPAVGKVTWAQVLALRLARQHLVERCAPAQVVDVARDLVGVHAQVMSAAELQLAARVDGLRPAEIRDLLWEQRRLVKVWAFRQTLHLLTPDDLAEFVVAARSLERWHTPAWLRYFVLTESQVAALIDAIGAALSDRPMTRPELVAAVTKRLRKPELTEAMLTGWGTFFAPAAQRGKLVFGPSDGRNVTFVSPKAWLGRTFDWRDPTATKADQALARLIVRYLAAFPGATKEMVARWWGGGRMSAINRALAVARPEIEEVDVEGSRGLVLRGDVEPLSAAAFRGVRLLPGFDPFTNELPRRVESVLPDTRHELVHRTAGWVTPIVLVDGRIAGTWELDGGKAGGSVTVVPFGRWRDGARKELAEEVERVAAFLDRRLSLSIGSAVAPPR